MNCQDREPDLLLFGLGELSPWKHRQMARHLYSCIRCRARQQELAALSGQVAEALRPPRDGTNRPQGPGAPQPLRVPRIALAPFVLMLALTLLTLSIVGVWYLKVYHSPQRVYQDTGCRPGLPNDRCK
jgi:anti-sigma factor RsiW